MYEALKGRSVNMLALDASSTAVGWAILEDGQHKLSGVHVPQKGEWWERVARIEAWLYQVCRNYRPSVIGYEIATGRHNNVHTDRVLGAVEYVVRNFAAHHGMPFIAVTASQVQAETIPNKRNLRLARDLKGAPLDKSKPGDEADAMGVGCVAWGKFKLALWALEDK